MERKRLVAVAVGALTVVGVGAGVSLGAGIEDDRPLQGRAFDRATAAALQEVGEGTVTETEVGDDGAAYGVEIRLDDGSQVEVELDESFDVTGTEQDEDGPGE